MREPLELSPDWPLYCRRLAIIASSGALGLGLLLSSLGLEAGDWTWRLAACAAWFWIPNLVLALLRVTGLIVWAQPDAANLLRVSPPWTLSRSLRQPVRDLARSSNFCLMFLFNHILAGAALFCYLYLESPRLVALFLSIPVWFSLAAVGLPPIAQLAAYTAYFVLVYYATT